MCFKSHHLLFFFLWSIACCYSQQQTQSTTASGLTTTHFSTDFGKITIYIPEHNINERISGSIHIESSGNSENTKAKNKANLQEYQLVIGEQVINLKSQNYSFITSQSFKTTLNLLDKKKIKF